MKTVWPVRARRRDDSPSRVLPVVLFAALVVGVGLPTAVHAQIVWQNLTNQDPWYDVGTNWVGAAAPGPAGTARFNAAGMYQVWWDNTTVIQTPSVGRVEVLAGDVTFLNKSDAPQHRFAINDTGASAFVISGDATRLTLRGLHVESSGGTEIIAAASLWIDGNHASKTKLTTVDFQVDGNLAIEAGGVVSNTNGYVGRAFDSTGQATVTGAGSQWQNSADLYVGRFGDGTLNIGAGGVVSNRFGYLGRALGSTGQATVTGAGSQWLNSADLFVGNYGNGTLNIEAGGIVSNTDGVLASESGSTGQATVTGSGSQWNNSGDLNVGFNGNGTLNIEAGGVVSNTVGVLGKESGSTGQATVTGDGSQWNSSGNLDVGFHGNGMLNIEAGGVVSNTDGFLGFELGSTGQATVTGAGSQWTTSNALYVG
jgi:T5SS/PEP-CTERM-associated repeat protein